VSATVAPNSIFDGITYNDFSLPLDFSYQVDVWDEFAAQSSSREQAQPAQRI